MMTMTSTTASTTSTDSTSSAARPCITAIGPNDVLCGRGGATNNNVGNRRYRDLVASFMTEYLAARKKEKGLLARRIVHIVHDNGGRFLQRAKTNNNHSITNVTNSSISSLETWIEVPLGQAVAKTSQALRENLDVRNKTLRPLGPHPGATMIGVVTTTGSDSSVASSTTPSRTTRVVRRNNRPHVVQGIVYPTSPLLVGGPGHTLVRPARDNTAPVGNAPPVTSSEPLTDPPRRALDCVTISDSEILEPHPDESSSTSSSSLSLKRKLLKRAANHVSISSLPEDSVLVASSSLLGLSRMNVEQPISEE